MPIVKYATLPTARMETYNCASQYRDLAVIDFSTNGHGVYNYGNLTRLYPLPTVSTAFSTHLSEVDIALGDISKLYNAIRELSEKGFKNIFLMPSSLSSVLGFDLENYAQECSLQFDVNVFTVPVRLNDDCFIGAQEILFALSSFVNSVSSDKDGFNLLGGRYTIENKHNHNYLAELISKELELQLNFDSLNAHSLSEWGTVSNASINIVTSITALKTAYSLQSKFGTPFRYFLPLSKNGEDKGLSDIAQIVGKSYNSIKDDEYDFAELQLRNILQQVKPKIVCYTDLDRLQGLKDFFKSIDITIEYFCSHRNDKFKYVEIEDFIEMFANKDYCVISYDRVCKYMKKSICIEYLGLDYKLITPLRKTTCGKVGAYRLMEDLANSFFTE